MTPARFKELDQRIATIHDLSRKHRIDPEQLPEVFEQLSDELNNLDHADENLEQLEKQTLQFKNDYLALADKLSKSRIKVAKDLNKQITQAMQTLSMTGGQFDIKVTTDNQASFTAHGLDNIEYTVSANPGTPCKALAKVASGGELARISLAIQMITAKQGRIPTLIFDEVDSGVGGGVAEIVGRHLRTLGKDCQVFCVTHLPQVASQAHHHLQVKKQTDKKQTITQINSLDEKQRVEEISRMLGGIEITQQTRAHAQEMLARSNQ